jgi:uncharacterized protein (DUF3084 family)
MDLNVLVTILFGAGGAGAVAGVLNVVKTMRSGKIEKEENLIRRLDAANKAQGERTEVAEKRADAAEQEAEEYRKQRNAAQERLAKIHWYVMRQYGDDLKQFEE